MLPGCLVGMAFASENLPKVSDWLVEARGKPKSLGWSEHDVDVRRQTDIEALLKQGVLGRSSPKDEKDGRSWHPHQTQDNIIRHHDWQMARAFPRGRSSHMSGRFVLLKELAPKDTYRLVGLSAFDLASESQGIQMALPLTQP